MCQTPVSVQSVFALTMRQTHSLIILLLSVWVSSGFLEPLASHKFDHQLEKYLDFSDAKVGVPLRYGTRATKSRCTNVLRSLYGDSMGRPFHFFTHVEIQKSCLSESTVFFFGESKFSRIFFSVDRKKLASRPFWAIKVKSFITFPKLIKAKKNQNKKAWCSVLGAWCTVIKVPGNFVYYMPKFEPCLKSR